MLLRKPKIFAAFLALFSAILLVSCGSSPVDIETPNSPEQIEYAPITPIEVDESTIDGMSMQEDELSNAHEPEIIPIDALPVWMYIPAINVDAEIQPTETDYERNTMDLVHSGSIISWWKVSAIPGNSGNAIFASHNIWNERNGQLHDLDTLEIGEVMEIMYDDGSSRVFKLESVFVYLLATAPADIIMDLRGDSRATLITCKGPFNYSTGTSDNRIVAIFKPESDFVTPDPPVEPFPLRQAN